MPKVHHQRAMKHYPEFGVSAGDMYYSWRCMGQKTQRSLNPPTRSQLTSSEWLQTLFTLFDEFVPVMSSEVDIEHVASTLERLAVESQENWENMPKQFRGPGTGERLSSRHDECMIAAAYVRELLESEYDTVTLRQAVANLEPTCE